MQSKRNKQKGHIIWKPEENYDREHEDNSMSVAKAISFQYEELGNEIVMSAMRDYAKAMRNEDWGKAKAVEKFFRSGFFTIICNIDPDRIMSLARQNL